MLLCLLTGRLSLSPPALPDAVFTLRRLFCFPQPNALTYTLLCFFDCLYHGILSLFVFLFGFLFFHLLTIFSLSFFPFYFFHIAFVLICLFVYFMVFISLTTFFLWFPLTFSFSSCVLFHLHLPFSPTLSFHYHLCLWFIMLIICIIQPLQNAASGFTGLMKSFF